MNTLLKLPTQNSIRRKVYIFQKLFNEISNYKTSQQSFYFNRMHQAYIYIYIEKLIKSAAWNWREERIWSRFDKIIIEVPRKGWGTIVDVVFAQVYETSNSNSVVLGLFHCYVVGQLESVAGMLVARCLRDGSILRPTKGVVSLKTRFSYVNILWRSMILKRLGFDATLLLRSCC